MNSKQRHEFFARLSHLNPHPTTELNYTSPFELLIAVILSAQATDISVNIATAKLYKVANTPQAIGDLGLAKLKTYIRTIGLFNTKAANILKTCQLLIDKFGSQVPSTRTELESLAGVVRKSANVILNTIFNEPTMAVDTHVFRVANRTGLATGNTPLAVENKLVKNIPKKFLVDAHHWLILHGRYICKATKPLCGSCPVNDLCNYYSKMA